MSIDYSIVCDHCKKYGNFGVFRARGFFVDQEDVNSFTYDHIKCEGDLRIVYDCHVSDDYKDNDPVKQKEKEEWIEEIEWRKNNPELAKAWGKALEGSFAPCYPLCQTPEV